ncbi:MULTISPECIES: DUF4192 family protein [unclassified Microbacterium]|uniref:DUF4192 family protein n=1 Tax=unclassified Microbacterium TaxID=2609290 RepID=UPI003866E1B1
MSTVVTAADAAHFLSLVPHLLGYTPTRSLVLVPMASGRSLGAMRVDLPAAHVDPDAAASSMIGLVCRISGADAVVAVAYTPARIARGLPTARLIAAIERSADACGIAVSDALTVAANGWGSHFDRDLPPGGRPLADLTVRTAPPPGDQTFGADLPEVAPAALESVEAAMTSLESSLAVLCGIPGLGRIDRVDPAALEAACALDDLPTFYEDALRWDATAIDPMRAALMAWCLARPSLRDIGVVQWSSDQAGGELAARAQLRWEEGEEYPPDLACVMWGEGSRPDPDRLDAALALVREVAARSPERLRAGALATAAWLSWALGRSTHADRYADQAEALDPKNGLAEIVRSFVRHSHLPDWAFER